MNELHLSIEFKKPLPTGMLVSLILFPTLAHVAVTKTLDHSADSAQAASETALDGGLMAQLPINLPLPLMQTKWSSQLNPVLANPINNVSILKNISLKNGTTIIPHLLQRNPQGWFLTDIQGAATIYRSAPFNNLTLTLTSNAAVTVNIGVF